MGQYFYSVLSEFEKRVKKQIRKLIAIYILQYSVGVMTKYDERDLLMQDFMTVETNVFPKNGGHHTPAHTFSDFKFSTFAPLAFRYFLNLFGVKRDDFMVSKRAQNY